MNKTDGAYYAEQSLSCGTLSEVLEAAGYVLWDSIYLSLMGRFICSDKNAENFISNCILERLTSTEVTLSSDEYEQTLGNIMYAEYQILTDGERYYLAVRDEYEWPEEIFSEYKLSVDEMKIIADELKRNVNDK